MQNTYCQSTNHLPAAVCLEMLIAAKLVKTFPTFYGTPWFITVFTRAHHWTLFRARWIQSISRHSISLRSIFIPSSHLRLDVPSVLFPSDFQTKILYAFLISPMRATYWCNSPFALHTAHWRPQCHCHHLCHHCHYLMTASLAAGLAQKGHPRCFESACLMDLSQHPVAVLTVFDLISVLQCSESWVVHSQWHDHDTEIRVTFTHKISYAWLSPGHINMKNCFNRTECWELQHFQNAVITTDLLPGNGFELGAAWCSGGTGSCCCCSSFTPCSFAPWPWFTMFRSESTPSGAANSWKRLFSAARGGGGGTTFFLAPADG
jgi:hypothetical protein